MANNNEYVERITKRQYNARLKVMPKSFLDDMIAEGKMKIVPKGEDDWSTHHHCIGKYGKELRKCQAEQRKKFRERIR